MFLFKSAALVAGGRGLPCKPAGRTPGRQFTGGFRLPSDRNTYISFVYTCTVVPGFNTVARRLGNILDRWPSW